MKKIQIPLSEKLSIFVEKGIGDFNDKGGKSRLLVSEMRAVFFISNKISCAYSLYMIIIDFYAVLWKKKENPHPL